MSTKTTGTTASLEWVLIVLMLGELAGCGDRGPALPTSNPNALTIRLSSQAFTEGGMIPREFTCDGADKSPPLEWSGVPPSARSLALLCDDPDAPMGTWSHWVLYDLDPGVRSIAGSVATDAEVKHLGNSTGAQDKLACRQGENDFGKVGYGGPCPPSGTHRYHFRLYALDQPVGLPPGATRSELFKAIQGHIVAEGHLLGKYAR